MKYWRHYLHCVINGKGMYKILIGLFLSVLCLQAKCQMQFDEGSFSEVLAKAKQEKRMVFMDCYTSWCGPCKMMYRMFLARKTWDNL